MHACMYVYIWCRCSRAISARKWHETISVSMHVCMYVCVYVEIWCDTRKWNETISVSMYVCMNVCMYTWGVLRVHGMKPYL